MVQVHIQGTSKWYRGNNSAKHQDMDEDRDTGYIVGLKIEIEIPNPSIAFLLAVRSKSVLFTALLLQYTIQNTILRYRVEVNDKCSCIGYMYTLHGTEKGNRSGTYTRYK